MSEGAPPTRGQTPFIVVSMLFLGIVHACLFFLAEGAAADHSLRDTDAYMWLNRVLHLAGDGSWWDHLYPRINPPEGHQQHWTRPFDALLLAGGTMVGGFLGFRDGLYHFALVLPPVFHAGALGVLFWGIRPLIRTGHLPEHRVPLLFLIFLAQIAIYQPFLAGRPDHHAPLAFLFVLHVVLWIRMMLARSGGGMTGLALGFTNALALWINPEAMIYIVICMASLAARWILTGDREASRSNALYGVGIATGMTVAVVVEWGPRLFQERKMDVVTYPHFALMLLVSAYWSVLHLLSDSPAARRVASRAGSALLLAAALFAILIPLFPEFLSDPLGEIDPLYRATRLERIGELQTLWSFGIGFLGGLGHTIFFTGAGIAALGFLVFLSRGGGPTEERLTWLTFLVLIGVYLAMSLRQARWTDYLGISAVIPFTLLGVVLLGRLSKEAKTLANRLARSGATLGFVIGPVVIGLALTALAGEGPGPPRHVMELTSSWDKDDSSLSTPDERTCDLVKIAGILNDPTEFPTSVTVMAHADYGPELLFRTPHSVLSIPNHRPQPGYRLTRGVLDNPDPDEAETLLLQSSTGALLLCLRDVTMALFGGTEEDLYVHELVRGRIPAGFELHSDEPGFRIYRRTPPPELDLSEHFDDLEGTFVLLDVQTGLFVRHDPDRARTRFVPASTFKIANTLIALETGVADGADFALSRDPSVAPREDWWPAVWGEDHILRSAFRSSVVWYYQELARRIGEERMRDWLVDFDFGNADISGGIDQFWLTGGLAISPDEQVEFLRRFLSGELDIAPENADLVKEMLVLEETPTYRLGGKTGWAGLGETGEPQVGWLVGYLERGPEVYVYATNIEIRTNDDAAARLRITRAILSELGLLETGPGG